MGSYVITEASLKNDCAAVVSSFNRLMATVFPL